MKSADKYFWQIGHEAAVQGASAAEQLPD